MPLCTSPRALLVRNLGVFAKLVPKRRTLSILARTTAFASLARAQESPSASFRR
jgi:hypothetical protein